MTGIDVSQHNGVIDWDKVKASGKVDFVILRCGFGREHANQIDGQFERNYNECKRVGIPVGVYHYSYATSVADAEKEAEFCLKLIKGKKLEYPVWYDIEEKMHINRGKCDDIAAAFCGKLEAAGYFAGVYTFDSFAKTNLTDKTKRRYAMWIARIGDKPKYSPYGMHQYLWKGHYDGIAGDVDVNKAYVDYPSTIKSRGLNGFSLPISSTTGSIAAEKQRYKVTAVADGLTADDADRVQRACSELGMTAVRVEV